VTQPVGKQRLANVDENALNSYQVGNVKAILTSRLASRVGYLTLMSSYLHTETTTVLPNGLTIAQQGAAAAIATKMATTLANGKTMAQEASAKGAATRTSTLTADGITLAQHCGIAGNATNVATLMNMQCTLGRPHIVSNNARGKMSMSHSSVTGALSWFVY
jgi:hypothetical protein